MCSTTTTPSLRNKNGVNHEKLKSKEKKIWHNDARRKKKVKEDVNSGEMGVKRVSRNLMCLYEIVSFKIFN